MYHIGNINSVQSTKLLRDFGLLNYYYLEYFNINENTYTHNIRSDIIIKDCSIFETYDDLIDYIDYNTAENYFNENNFPIQDFCDYLLYLRLVDCAIYNYDRHTGNIIYFQYISDNSIHIAPIHDFDCTFDVDCYEISNTCFDILKYGLYLCDDNIDLYNYLINLPENHYLYDYIQTFILNKFKFSTNFGSFS